MSSPAAVLPLNESARVILDSGGSGTVTLGPQRAGITWFVRTLTVQVNKSNQIPTCKVYRGPVSSANLLGGTYNGAQDTMGPDTMLYSGMFLTAVWDGGDAGAQATVSIQGDLAMAGGS